MKGYKMRVLAKNVVLFFYCKGHKLEKCQMDVEALWEEGTPICGICDKPMTLKKECLVTN
jgi:hypothetical protein